MPDISLPLSLLKKPIEVAINLATGPGKESLAKLRATNNIKTVYQKLNSTQKIKTIWNVDRPIALSSFYFPAKIRTRENIAQPLACLDDLPSNAVVLSGIVGQGKSILLKHLLGKEIRSGKRVPLFIELRRISATGLEANIRNEFSGLLDVKGYPELFDIFASKGLISLLLDGFDEVDPERVQEILTTIDGLAARFPEMRLVVTSRPDTAIVSSPHFDVVPLAPFSEYDYAGFFQKILSKDKPLAERITRAVLTSPTQVKSLATTPLLATLLTVVYRANQKIPTDFSEFYDELFQILLIRHDRAKSGWERKRKTKLSDRETQLAFEAYCYKLKAEGVSSVVREKAFSVASAALKACNLSADECHFVADIVKATCLLQQEGNRIEFLHQSVQEFFASKYVASRPDDLARQFYSTMLSSRKWDAWDQVLRFLKQVDGYRSGRYFFIPALLETLAYFGVGESDISPENVRRLVGDVVFLTQHIEPAREGRPSQKKYVVDPQVAPKLFLLPQVYARLFDVFYRSPGAATKGNWMKLFDGVTNGQKFSYTEVAEATGLSELLISTVRNSIGDIKSELVKYQSEMEMANQSRDFMGL